MSSPFPIAAIVPRAAEDVDGLLLELARDLNGRGLRVRGLVQTEALLGGNCQVVLVDVADGSAYPITQDLGAESQACSLDPGALAEASVVLRRAGEEGADLVIFNRFGNMEAVGRGLAAEMLEIMSRGLPVLTVVQEKNLPAWRHFTGGLAMELEPSREAMEGWFAGLKETGL